MDNFNLIIWNFQGAGNKRFKLYMQELKRVHKPDVVVLVEPWVNGSKANSVVADMGFLSS